ncbi:MAG: hypothetical protein O3A20_05860 [Planctomycetota bacterium]|nr:hypothetical protein [Planctomycetota bacterium]
MFGQFFFWAGLAAVAAFFIGVALLGLGFFTPSETGRRRLCWAQSAVAASCFAFTAAGAWMLRARLAPWAVDPPPEAASAVVSAMRETMSLMLLGLSCTVSALLLAFAWVRLGRAGAAFRALLWAFPAVRLVTVSVGMLDFFGELRATEAGAASSAAAWSAIAAAAERSLLIAVSVATGLFLLSWPLGLWLARMAKRPETAHP